MTRAQRLSVRGLEVRLGAEQHVAVASITFDLEARERVALLGPSGCGKTTTLRAIAGFEQVFRGEVRLDGEALSNQRKHVPPHERRLGMVFQDFALFPHLTVAENIAFGLRAVPKSEHRARVNAWLEQVDLQGLQARKPGELSGGQQQRVALARALAPEPGLVLLDEPFSSLDTNLRATTRQQTEQLLARAGATALLVTHDRAEAMSFADRLIVLRAGRIEQQGTPEALYRFPKNAFVATFLGEANLLSAEVGETTASSALGPLSIERAAADRAAPGGAVRGAAKVCLRPEALSLTGDAGAARGQVVAREYLGPHTSVRVRGEGFEVSVSLPGSAPADVGETVGVRAIAPASVLEE